MPVHSVELGHLVLLNVNIEDSGMPMLLDTILYSILQPAFKPSDFAIINTDGHSDFETETSLSLRDEKNGKLQLKLNYMYVPFSNVLSSNIKYMLAVTRILEVLSKFKFIAHTLSSTRRACRFL